MYVLHMLPQVATVLAVFVTECALVPVGHRVVPYNVLIELAHVT